MSALPILSLVSIDDYLKGEAVSQIKHEYLAGVVHAMSGGSIQHGDVSGRAFGSLFVRLRGGVCRPCNSDIKVRVGSGVQTRFYYPDCSVVCDGNEKRLDYEDRPVVIVEVLSPSTRRIDDGEKRLAYLGIPSLRVYLMVEPEQPHVLVDRRDGEGEAFLREVHQGMAAVIPLPEIGTELPLRELYED